MIQMNLFTKQKDTDLEKELMDARWRGRLEGWDN